MADQYRVIARVTGNSPVQVGAGLYWIRAIHFCAVTSDSYCKIRDETGVAESTTPIAEVYTLAKTSRTLHFDSSGGGLRLTSGLLVTPGAADSIVYIYGS